MFIPQQSSLVYQLMLTPPSHGVLLPLHGLCPLPSLHLFFAKTNDHWHPVMCEAQPCSLFTSRNGDSLIFKLCFTFTAADLCRESGEHLERLFTSCPALSLCHCAHGDVWEPSLCTVLSSDSILLTHLEVLQGKAELAQAGGI